MIQIIMTNNSELMPNSPEDKIKIDKMKGGDLLNCTLDKRRSNPQLDTLWKVMQIGVNNMPQFRMGKAKERLMDIVKVELGHSIKYKINNVWKEIPKSISFFAMSHDKFNTFFQDAV